MIEKPEIVEKRTIVEQTRPVAGEQRNTSGTYLFLHRSRLLIRIAVAAIAVIVFCAIASGWVQKWINLRRLAEKNGTLVANRCSDFLYGFEAAVAVIAAFVIVLDGHAS